MESISAKLKNADLGARSKTAIYLIVGVLVIGILSLLTCVFQWVLLNATCIVVALCAYEYGRFASDKNRIRQVLLSGILFLPALAAWTAANGVDLCSPLYHPGRSFGIICAASALSFFAFFALVAFRPTESLERVSQFMGEALTALLLVGTGGGALIALSGGQSAFLWILWLLLVVCVGDTAAYFAGRRWGKLPIAPLLSPKKTVIGSLAGVLGSVIIGLLSGPFTIDKAPLYAAGLALVVAVAAQCGDLMKSLLKRLHNVKDSGSILPGHGGVFDRVDGVLAGALVLFLYRYLTEF